MPAIKITGRKTSTTSKAKPAASRKTAAKSSGAKATTRSTGRSTAAKSNGRAKAPGSGTKMSDGRVRRATTDDQKIINSFIKRLQKAGEKRSVTEQAHKDAVEAVYEITREAMEAGVPTGVITEHSGISRQWLYKMGEHGGRENGNGSKPAAKKTAAKPRGRKPAAKSTATKKTTGRRPKIRTR